MQSDSESKIAWILNSFFQLDIWRGRITIILSNSYFFPKQWKTDFYFDWHELFHVMQNENILFGHLIFFSMQRQWQQISQNCEQRTCDSLLFRMQKKTSANRDLIRCNPCIQDVLLPRILAYFESGCLARCHSFIF